MESIFRYFNEGMIKKLKESLSQANKGEYLEITSEDIKDLLGL